MNNDSARQSFIEAVRQGVEADRHNANKWDPLYRWFRDQLGVGTGTSGGPVVGKVVTEVKQIGNRIDEMAKTDPRYAILSLSPGVTSDRVLRMMRKRASLASLRLVLFLDGLAPTRLVIFDD